MPACDVTAPTTLRTSWCFSRAAWRRASRCGIALLTALVLLGLLVATTVPIRAFPSGTWLFRLTTLAYLVRTLSLHVGLAMLVPLVVAVFLRSRRLATVVALTVLWCIAPACCDYVPRSPSAITGESLQILTCNLLRPNRHIADVAAQIAAADPDIVCFQEYATHWHEGLTARLAHRFPYRVYAPRQHDMGLAIYSKRPLLGDMEYTDFRGTPPAQPLRVEIELAGRRVALYNLHMFQPWPPATMAWHQLQLAGVCARLANERLPLILAGDFNSTPTSPTMTTFANLNLTDAWDVAGWGRGSTWPNVALFRHLPGIRIDHVCLSPELTCAQCRVGITDGSDHRQVMAQVGFKTERN